MIVHSLAAPPPVRDTLVLWKDGRSGLHALPLGGYETRHSAVLDLVAQADREHDVPPFDVLVVATLDQPVSTDADGWRSYAFCTAPGHVDVAVPDFVFGGWPQVGIDDFDETCARIAEAGDRPAERGVVGWIGSRHTHPVRDVLLELGKHHPDLLDVRQVDWVTAASPGRLQAAAGNSLSLPEQVGRWGALLDVEGKGYSGRLKLLLHSGRPVLVQDRPWREWWQEHLRPLEHYIPVRRDLADLVERAREVQQDPQEATRIGRAGQELAKRLLTRRAAVEHWAQTLRDAAAHGRGDWGPPALRQTLTPVLRALGALA